MTKKRRERGIVLSSVSIHFYESVLLVGILLAIFDEKLEVDLKDCFQKSHVRPLV